MGFIARGISLQMPEGHKRRNLVSTQHRLAAELVRWISAAFFILIAVWMIVYEGGLAWAPGTVFNIHPFSVSLGIIMLGSWGAVMYRSIPTHKHLQKTLHATCNVAVLGLIGLGLAAVVTDKLQSGAPHFKSLHSWIGITAISMIVLQAFMGIGVFILKPLGISPYYREWLRPYHAGLGLWALFTSCIAAATGILETMADDKEASATGQVTGFLLYIPLAAGLLLVFLVGALMYTLSTPRTSIDLLAEHRANGMMDVNSGNEDFTSIAMAKRRLNNASRTNSKVDNNLYDVHVADQTQNNSPVYDAQPTYQLNDEMAASTHLRYV